MPSPGGASALLAAGVTELLEHSVLLGNPGVAGVRTQARTLAAGRSPSRILMLTVAGSLTDRVDGPGMGADDYLATSCRSVSSRWRGHDG